MAYTTPFFLYQGMSSIFYRAKFERRLPLTLLFLEHLQMALGSRQLDEDIPFQFVFSQIKKALIVCGISESPSKEDISYIFDRLVKLIEETKDIPEPQEMEGKTFASSYVEWANGLDPDATCLIAASFDYFLASRYYSELDREDLLWLVAQFMRHDWEHVRVNFESVIYGFGGSYADDDSIPKERGSEDPDVIVYDLTKDNPEGIAALQGWLGSPIAGL